MPTSNTSPQFVVAYALLEATSSTTIRLRYVGLDAFCESGERAEEAARELVNVPRPKGVTCLPRVIKAGPKQKPKAILTDATKLFEGVVSFMNAVAASATK